jgi:OmpA-OmpF porin, OOP family
MKKLLLVSAFAVITIPTLATAQSQTTPTFGSNIDTNQLDNFFVDGNLGTTRYRDASASGRPHYVGALTHGNGVFQNVRFGWRWNGIIGPEIGYAYLGEGKQAQPKLNSTYSIQSKALTVGLNGKFNFYQKWFVTGHAGWLRTYTDVGYAVGNNYTCYNKGPSLIYCPGSPFDISNKSYGSSWYAGLGMGYDVTEHVSVGVTYDNYNVKYNANSEKYGQPFMAKRDAGTYSASIEYRL